MRENTKLNATKDVSKQKSLFRIWICFFVRLFHNKWLIFDEK